MERPETITLPEIVAYRATTEVNIFIDFFSEVFLQLQRRAPGLCGSTPTTCNVLVVTIAETAASRSCLS